MYTDSEYPPPVVLDEGSPAHATGEEPPAGVRILTCTQCGTKFSWKPRGGTPPKTCSHACRELAKVAYNSIPERIAARKTRAANPKYKENQRKYNGSPERVAARKAYAAVPEHQSAQKVYHASLVAKAALKARNADPNRKAKLKLYIQSPEGQRRIKIYRQSPAGRARRRACEARRRAVRAAALGAGYTTKEMIAARAAMWGNKCAYCGGPYEAIDHVIPLQPRPGEPKGTHYPANLRPSCKSCNSRKQNRSLSTWLKELKEEDVCLNKQG